MNEPEWAEHLMRYEHLVALYGKPEQVNVHMALSALGITVTHADDVIAFRYSSVKAAEAFAASNLAHNGVASLGIKETDKGVIGATWIPTCNT
jgi:hypothetical protein